MIVAEVKKTVCEVPSETYVEIDITTAIGQKNAQGANCIRLRLQLQANAAAKIAEMIQHVCAADVDMKLEYVSEPD